MTSDLGKIWVFDQSKLDEAIDKYRDAAITAYPQQADKINLTLLAVRDFLNSEFAEKLTMNVKVTEPHHDDV